MGTHPQKSGFLCSQNNHRTDTTGKSLEEQLSEVKCDAFLSDRNKKRESPVCSNSLRTPLVLRGDRSRMRPAPRAKLLRPKISFVCNHSACGWVLQTYATDTYVSRESSHPEK